MNALWIIGFRAAGKSTFGESLARSLGLPFLDLDREWEQRAKISIVNFAEKNGLDAFRKEEESLLRETSVRMRAGERLVVATGGGFVDWPPARAILEESSFPKLYLDPPAEVLWERLKNRPDRQKIGHLSSFAAMEALLEKRRPFYEKIASIHWKDQDITGCLAALKKCFAR